MRHGSLFSGIGGFDLAAEWMGWENVFHCEWNDFGQRVLKHYWPNAESFHDITKTDFTKYEGTIDIISGGFPCQPYSSAGKRRGKEDERHLWPHMLRAIQEIQPRFVVGENVRGLVNWNGGLVFNEVHSDLESAGYDVAAFLIPAAAVNAPHGRDRIWFVAKNTSGIGFYNGKNEAGNWGNRQFEPTSSIGQAFETPCNVTNPDSNGLNQCNGNDEINPSEGGQYAFNDADKNDGGRDVANAERNGLEHRNKTRNLRSKEKKTCRKGGQFANDIEASGHKRKPNWDNFPTQPPICGGNDGLPRELDGVTFSKWRNESIKGYGNAIVPQVAYQIFKTIQISL